MSPRTAARVRPFDLAIGAGFLGLAFMHYRQFVARGRVLLRVAALESVSETPQPVWDSLPIGSVVPDFAAHDLTDGVVRLTDLHGAEIDLLFLDPDDPLSADVVAVLRTRDPRPDDPRPLVVSTGSPEATRACLGAHPPFTVVADGMAIAQRLEVPAVPAIYQVDASGYLVALSIGVRDVIVDLGARSSGGPPRLVPAVAEPRQLHAGDRAPHIPTMAADGSITYLPVEPGRPDGSSIVLFADPDCEPAIHAASAIDESAIDLAAVVTRGGAEAADRITAAAHLDDVRVIPDCGAWDRYTPLGIPAAFIIGGDGVLIRPEATGLAAITNLIKEFT